MRFPWQREATPARGRPPLVPLDDPVDGLRIDKDGYALLPTDVKEQLDRIEAKMADSRLALYPKLLGALRLHEWNGTTHYKDADGHCFNTCVGCGLEEITRAVLKEAGE